MMWKLQKIILKVIKVGSLLENYMNFELIN